MLASQNQCQGGDEGEVDQDEGVWPPADGCEASLVDEAVAIKSNDVYFQYAYNT